MLEEEPKHCNVRSPYISYYPYARRERKKYCNVRLSLSSLVVGAVAVLVEGSRKTT